MSVSTTKRGGNRSPASRALWQGIGVRCSGVVHIFTTAGGHDVVALRGVNLSIGAGEQLALLGPSGSGKSTLLNLLAGVLRPSAGQIMIDGQDISRMNESSLGTMRSSTMSYLVQGAGRNLIPYVDAVRNIDWARRALPSSQRRELPPASELLARLGIEDLGRTPVARLSQGQRQQVALAAAISTGAGLLLADEPTSQLGHQDRDLMLDQLDRLHEDFGTTVVIVTHDPDVAARVKRTVTIRSGRVGQEGRAGADFAIVDEDGAVHLPEDLTEQFPVGSLLRFEETADGVLMRRVEEDEA